MQAAEMRMIKMMCGKTLDGISNGMLRDRTLSERYRESFRKDKSEMVWAP